MAAIKKVFDKCQIFKLKSQFTSCILTQQNGMAVYPSYYIKPIYKKENQEEMIKSGEAQKLAHIPTRAPLNHQTCSANHDPLVDLFINYCMRDGKKIVARSMAEQTFEHIKRFQLAKYHKCENEEDKSKIELDPKKSISHGD
ncbi:hypothetical protein NQ317_015834 [Molorchus minor]|uniref:Small ribosomal subunit protein uS7 domain-containing protein n=1 Tax=Molorchus minor TaxID=1323400 RepID=A0ABQ9JPB6_9CUCU|nr:hypothetical protein NQ317_015834 [Molorchus minor]